MPNLRKSPPAKDDHAIRQDFTNPSVFGKDPEPKVQAPDGGSGVVITVRQIRLETKSVRIYLKNPSLTVFSWFPGQDMFSEAEAPRQRRGGDFWLTWTKYGLTLGTIRLPIEIK